MPPVQTLTWLLSQLALVALYALALLISVRVVTRAKRSHSANAFLRAMLIAAALLLFSHAVSRHVPGAMLGAAVMLAIWCLVVRWAYSLRWLDTVLVGIVMLVLSLGAVRLLGIVLRVLGTAAPF